MFEFSTDLPIASLMASHKKNQLRVQRQFLALTLWTFSKWPPGPNSNPSQQTAHENESVTVIERQFRFARELVAIFILCAREAEDELEIGSRRCSAAN